MNSLRGDIASVRQDTIDQIIVEDVVTLSTMMAVARTLRHPIMQARLDPDDGLML